MTESNPATPGVARSVTGSPQSGASKSRVSSKLPMVRVGEAEYRMLRELSEIEKRSIQSIVEAAIRAYDRESFLKRADESYRALRADPKAWEEELRERAEWDAVLSDGLDLDEKWDEDGRPMFAGSEDIHAA